MKPSHKPRLIALDVLRGLAAVGVVFWHWQHFVPLASSFDPGRAPLAGAALLFYRHGWLAVDLFFCMSGFIFFWMYSQPVAGRALGAARFGWLRATRLYPLHLLTLLLVTLGQWLLARRGTDTFVYSNNDSWHFALNLVFANSWGLENGYSFNGPAWSISVEVLLYALFFGFCRWMPLRWPLLLSIAASGFAFAQFVYAPLGRGVGSFFLGGLMFVLHERLQLEANFRLMGAILLTAVAAWIATFLGVYAGLAEQGGRALRVVLHAWPLLVLFPLTVLALAAAERRLGGALRPLQWLGDISYSLYLWHFPLQLALFIALGEALARLAYQAWFMAAFIGVLTALSLASFHGFEIPLQKRLRRLTPRRSTVSTPAC